MSAPAVPDALESPAAHARYLRWVLTGIVGIGALCLGLNLAVDPLWFGAGNAITGRNHMFNERLSKLNLLLQAPHRYDCFIIGSSRATLLDAGLIEGHRCFNLAFSGGLLAEFTAYVGYLRSLGIDPALLVVGIDGFNFARPQGTGAVPEFVLARTAPPGRLASYLSIDSLGFSVRALLGGTRGPLETERFPRYYTRDFSPAIRESAPKFRPKRVTRFNTEDEAYDPRDLEHVRALRKVIGNAEVRAYVPPISLWHVMELERKGDLEAYLRAIHATSRLFSPLYDFSIPSAVTSRTDDTYDGSHYDLAINARIAAVLNGEPPASGFGVRPDDLDFDDYRRRFLDALVEFRSAATP